MNTVLPAGIKQRIIDYALTEPDREVCGLLGGREGMLTSFFPIRNIADDRTREYLMDPVQQIAAMKQIRNDGDSMNAIFHSHPASPAGPSQKDLSLAYYPEIIYLILSLQRVTPDLRAYYFNGDSFQEISIHTKQEFTSIKSVEIPRI